MIETFVVEPYKLIENPFCDFRWRSAIYFCNTEPSKDHSRATINSFVTICNDTFANKDCSTMLITNGNLRIHVRAF